MFAVEVSLQRVWAFFIYAEFIMNKKKTLGTMLSLAVTVAVMFAFGSAVSADEVTEVTSGSCGDNVSYTLNSEGLLEITGTGAMTDYSYSGQTPWYEYHDSIKAVTISDGITHIGAHSFNYYTTLENATIPSSVTSVGQYAFYYCVNLETGVLSDNITEVGDFAFYYCEKLAIPNFPHNIEKIGMASFQKCLDLKDLTIPDSVKTIGDRAFSGCANLETVTFPTGSNLQFSTLPSGCFNGCQSLNNVVIPSGITGIGSYVFLGCKNLTDISIPDSVTSIGGGAFDGCTKLTSITIPDSVNSIGESAFSSTGLTSIVIPNGITTIGSYCFNGCYSLQTIDIPSTVDTIGNNAFEDCTSLKTVVIPNGVTTIQTCTFAGCEALESVNIPNTVTKIEQAAFSGCNALTKIEIPDSVLEISPVTFRDTAITSLTVPGSIYEVPSYAFSENPNLQSVVFCEGIQKINGNALADCDGLKTVVIPSTVYYVGEEALGFGESIKDIYLYADPDGIILNLDSTYFSPDAKIHVPSRYLNNYKEYHEAISALFVGDADGEINIGGGTHLCGHSITLDGTIGVNFYMTLSNEVLDNSETAYMQFTVNEKTQIVSVKDAKRSGDYYIFRCDIVAKEMTDKITAQMYLADGNGLGEDYTYTVRDYAVYILNHSSNYSNATVTLVKSMLNYGAAAQIYFNYNVEDLANSVVNDSNKPSMVMGEYKPISMDTITYRGYDFDHFVFTAGEVTLAKVSLSLKSTLTLKLYFSNVPEGTVFTYQGKEMTTTKSGSYKVVTIEGINPYDINEWVEIGVSYADGSGTIIYNPLRYLKGIMNSPEDDQVTWELKQVVAALVRFQSDISNYVNPQ